MVKDSEAWHAAIHGGHKELELNDMKTTNISGKTKDGLNNWGAI